MYPFQIAGVLSSLDHGISWIHDCTHLDTCRLLSLLLFPLPLFRVDRVQFAVKLGFPCEERFHGDGRALILEVLFLQSPRE